MKTFYNSIRTSRFEANRLGNENPEATIIKIKSEIKEPFIIIDGSDDLFMPPFTRPEVFVKRELVLAYYHSGISGITKSGVIIKQSDFEKIKEEYQTKFKMPIDSEIPYEGSDRTFKLHFIYSDKS